ncbi:Na+/H+ antiporter NhaA [Sinorhizobium sp. KGO-5]|uniref:Na+/H+ antiporter NhaA n=1 Tax=Sinorhizobium sp. KGO-5 TaxID=1470810 RepID=UPI00403EEE81
MSLLTAGSLLTSIGFTISLSIADLAFDPERPNSVNLGILGASVISAALGFLLTWQVSPGRR